MEMQEFQKIPKIIVILGPTSSGKSDVAIGLAKKFNGEVISADSRQVYRGMDIGSGKVPKDPAVTPGYGEFISEGVIHHLIDVADPNEDFNISHFKTLAGKAIEKILEQGKLPIICGGTGFWIDAIVKNIALPEVAPNEKLREQLSDKTLEELFSELEKMDPERAQSIDSKNKIRLIRAIEICRTIGKVPKINTHQRNMNYQFLQIGMDVPREALNEKIKKRLGARFEEGMIEEVEKLHKTAKVSWKRLEAFGLEYRWIARYLQKKVSFEKMQEKLYFDIIHYAKRQMTWFKKDPEIRWLKNYKEIEKEVGGFMKNK